MKLKMNQTLVGYKGETIKETVMVDGKPQENPITLREILSNALNNVVQNEQLVAEDKNKRYQLSLKLYANNEIDLTVNERAYVLDLVAKIYNSPLVYGRVSDLLEGKALETSDHKAPKAQ